MVTRDEVARPPAIGEGSYGPLVDTHCHLDLPAFDSDREAVLAEARAAGVTRILVPAIQASGWTGLLALCREQAGLYPALGLHPLFLDSHSEQQLEALQQRLEENPPTAIGEIGLDFSAREADRERQQALFEAQLRLAARTGLPVLLHIRKAHEAALSALRRIPVAGGIVHAFSGGLPQARHYLELGLRLGFGGRLTFAHSTRLHALAGALPAEALVLETDAPDMTGAAHRGECNRPGYLPEVLLALAAWRGETPAAVARQTTANAARVLGWTA